METEMLCFNYVFLLKSMYMKNSLQVSFPQSFSVSGSVSYNNRAAQRCSYLTHTLKKDAACHP